MFNKRLYKKAIAANKMIKEKYTQLNLYRQIRGIRTIAIYKRCRALKETEKQKIKGIINGSQNIKRR